MHAMRAARTIQDMREYAPRVLLIEQCSDQIIDLHWYPLLGNFHNECG